jgi:alkanesulfonate monooxygenase SsuD/methylene tetrahydromethanopterin reductase-like flavin-dependent oxidoreductase (luciferase family)
MSKEIHFNGFEMNTVSHINHGLWVHPDNRRHEYTDIEYWTETAQLLERGLFDAIFLADVAARTKCTAAAAAPRSSVDCRCRTTIRTCWSRRWRP